MKYETIKNEIYGDLICRTNDDGSLSFIPKDEGNSDYQAYLKSLNEAASL